MKFLINASNLIVGGGIQVGNAVICELQSHPEHEYCVVCSEQVARSLGDMKAYPDFIQFKTVSQQSLVDKFFRIFRFNPFLDNCVREFSADAVFTVFGSQVFHTCAAMPSRSMFILIPLFSSPFPSLNVSYQVFSNGFT